MGAAFKAPWRPSKLRFEVEAQRSPRLQPVVVHARGTSSSRARAIRSRRPMKILSRPSASACSFTRPEPGTIMASTVASDLLAVDDLGDGAQILDAAIGAGADEDALERDIGHLGAGRQAHIVERAPLGGALVLVLDRRRVRAPRR